MLTGLLIEEHGVLLPQCSILWEKPGYESANSNLHFSVPSRAILFFFHTAFWAVKLLYNSKCLSERNFGEKLFFDSYLRYETIFFGKNSFFDYLGYRYIIKVRIFLEILLKQKNYISYFQI